MAREAASRRPVERAREKRRECARERGEREEREREKEKERVYADIRVSPVTAILRKTFDLFAHAE